jgi:hypothetical protein
VLTSEFQDITPSPKAAQRNISGVLGGSVFVNRSPDPATAIVNFVLEDGTELLLGSFGIPPGDVTFVSMSHILSERERIIAREMSMTGNVVCLNVWSPVPAQSD